MCVAECVAECVAVCCRGSAASIGYLMTCRLCDVTHDRQRVLQSVLQGVLQSVLQCVLQGKCRINRILDDL